MHWCHSLALRITTETHIYTIEYLPHFLLIVVSFLTYLIIFTPDKNTTDSPSHHWHNFLAPTIKAKTQTRSMVLFTSGSSLTWGNLQALCMASPPGIYLLSTPNNQLFMSLQKLYDDWIHILCQQGRQVVNNMMALWGNLDICPHLNYLELQYHTLRGTAFHQLPKNLGGHSGAQQWHGLSPSLHRRLLWGLRIMAWP